MITHHQAMVYKRDLVGDLKYDARYKIAADYDFTFRYLKKSPKIFYYNKPICIFESGGVSENNALQGRIEQFKIRQNLKINIFKNIYLFSAQSLIYALRKISPQFYWWLKRSFTRA